MKKLILLTVLFAFTTVAKAQLSLQPMVGVNFSSFKGVKDDKLKVGLAAGGELEYKFSANYGLSVGAIYTQEGSKYPLLVNTSKDANVKLEYLNVPILFNDHFYRGWNAQIGLQVGFLTKATVDHEYNDLTNYLNGGEELLKNKDVKDKCNSIDWGIPINLSYQFNSGFVFMVRTYTSLAAVFKGSAPGRNKYVMLGLGYNFDL